MEEEQSERQRFTGFGLGTIPRAQPEDGVFLLVVYRDGGLSAAAHATERGAMAAAAEFLEDDRGDDDEPDGTLEDLFARAQRAVEDDGGLMEIVPSPVHGG